MPSTVALCAYTATPATIEEEDSNHDQDLRCQGNQRVHGIQIFVQDLSHFPYSSATNARFLIVVMIREHIRGS